MSAQDWSPELWGPRDSNESGLYELSPADWARARNCVDAMAGKDPAAYVAAFDEMLALLHFFVGILSAFEGMSRAFPEGHPEGGTVANIIARAEAARGN